ncbi:MAG: hypothetical protein WEA09_00980 [Gemmatimonadota bacterium]
MDSGNRSEYLWTAGLVGGSMGVGAGVGAGALLLTGGLLPPWRWPVDWRQAEPAPASWTGWVKKQMRLFGSEWRNQ